jgi:hypothetical protein
MDRHDIGMHQSRGSPCLGPELLTNRRLPGKERGIHDLEGTDAVQLEVSGPENAPHRSLTQKCFNLVLCESGANQITPTGLRISSPPGMARACTGCFEQERGRLLGNLSRLLAARVLNSCRQLGE